MMTPHATRDVSTLKGHAAPMKSLCGYRTFGGEGRRGRQEEAGQDPELPGGQFRSRILGPRGEGGGWNSRSADIRVKG